MTGKVFLSLFLIVLFCGFAAAKDIAYVTKTAESPVVSSILNELGYSYDVIYDAAIPSTNFSNYAVILTQGDLNNKLLIPFSSKNSRFVVDSSSKNVVPLVWSTVQLASSQTIYSNLQQLGTPFTENFPASAFRHIQEQSRFTI